jgi:hypothetical protein
MEVNKSSEMSVPSQIQASQALGCVLSNLDTSRGEVELSGDLNLGTGETSYSKECIEGLWYRRMSEKKMLCGHRLLERELDNGRKSRETLFRVLQHYATAVAYLKQHAEQALEQWNILWQIYNSLKQCRLEDLRYLQDEALPAIAEIQIPHTPAVYDLLNEALSLALEVNYRRALKEV